MKVYSIVYDEYTVGVTWTSDTSTEHVYACDDTLVWSQGLQDHLSIVENTLEQYVNDSIECEKLRFRENRKISENEKNDFLKKMNFSNIWLFKL